jgi:CBS domain containing-hemolysin-like protein
MNILFQILISIGFSAFFSGMEMAFVSSNKLRFEMKKNDNDFTSKIISLFYKNSNNFISTMLVGNNISLVVYGILMAKFIQENILSDTLTNEPMILLTQTVIATLIILVTGEFLPKTIFKINPNFTLRLFAPITYLFYIILFPISKLSSSISTLILRLFGTKINKKNSEKAFSKVDLDYFIQNSIAENEDNQKIDSEIKIFQNALDFSKIKIRDCMIPRPEIISMERNCTLEELKDRFIESGKSKIIIYDKNIDNIIGYIHSSELFYDINEWKDRIREIPIIPETMAANKLMQLFMQQKKSIAIVVDEFGGTSGIVTLEDLVEEIFGEIEDEHDSKSDIVKKISENEYIFSGRSEIEYLNDLFDLDLPESEEYKTIGGLILNEYQSFPKAHDIISLGKYKFKIIKTSNTRIELVKMNVLE